MSVVGVGYVASGREHGRRVVRDRCLTAALVGWVMLVVVVVVARHRLGQVPLDAGT